MDRAANSFIPNTLLLLLIIGVSSLPGVVNAAPAATQQPTSQGLSTSIVTDAVKAAADQLICDAQRSIQQSAQNTEAALREFMRNKFTNLSINNQLDINEERLRLSLDASTTVNVFAFFGINNNPLQVTLEEATYYFNSSQLNVITRGYGSQTIIPNVLQLQNAILNVSVNLQNISTLVVNFTGDWVIDTATTVSLQAVYYEVSTTLSFRAQLSSFSINLQNLASNIISGVSLPSALSGTLTISELVLSGTATPSLGSHLYLKLTTGSTMVYFIYQLGSDSTSKKAVAAEISNIQFSTILQDMTGLDMAGIPYFGSVTASVGFTYATDIITYLPNDLFPSNTLLSKVGDIIPQNFTAVVSFGFSPIAIRVSLLNGIPTFHPVIPRSISISSLLSAIPHVDISSIPLPPGIGDFPQLGIDGFFIDVSIGAIVIDLDFPRSLNFFNGLLTVENPLPRINISALGVRLDMLGIVDLSNIDLTAFISLDVALNQYKLSASVDSLPITSVITQLQADILPSELNSFLSGTPFLSFSVNSASVSYCFGSSPPQIHLSGTPVISGYSTVHMASVITRQGSRTLLVQGFELGSLNLATFLNTLTGFSFNHIALLNQNLDVALLISPSTLPNVQLTGDSLSTFSVTRGVSVQASMQFPADCSSDSFCAVAQFLLGANAQLSLRGTIASTTSFSLFAGVSNINLGNGVVMSEAGVEIRAGTVTSVGIVGEVDLSNPDITLAARVFLSTSGVVLEMTMSGCWENAFGASFLDVCHLLASVAMAPGVTVTAFAFGGEIHLGDDTCGTPLVATGFVGIDAVTPTQNYYYANFPGSTTIATILRALCVSGHIPAPLAQSGFPRGFTSSFSLVGVELPHVPLSIPLGYRLNGTLNILGLEGSADVTIGLPNGIDIAVALPPIEIGGELLQMFASSSDRSRGPNLATNINLLPTPNVNIQLSGHVRVLGISVDTTVAITDTQYLFRIQGIMLGLFMSNLQITAPYGNIRDASFRVNGTFTSSLYDTIENEIRTVFQSASQLASGALDAAQELLRGATSTLNSARSNLERGRDEVRQAQNALNNAQESACSIRQCGSVCVGCINGATCCGSVWGQCVCWRPRWNGCCHRITDPTCEAANALCNAARETIMAASATLDVATAAIGGLEQAVSEAEGRVRSAEQAVSDVQTTHAAGLQVLSQIQTVGLDALINIREISFDVELATASSGSFSASITAVFGGTAETTVSLNVNLYDIPSMARELAEHIGSGLSSLF